jgi:hypothetical protein
VFAELTASKRDLPPAIDLALEDILGCEVDLLTRRSVEQDQNSIRRLSILESTREIYAAEAGRLPARYSPVHRRHPVYVAGQTHEDFT